MIQAVVRINSTKVLFSTLAVVLTSLILASFFSTGSFAADGKDFRPGRIIDDAIFYNDSSMTATQIQSFLNGKVPNCDTNGTGIASEFGSNLTRAQYAASVGWQSPPYTCLRNFVMNTPQVEAASQLCEGMSAKSNRTAAQIILDVAQACGINPQVLLVLLQKEQSLVTDIWPLNTQYRYATGFACPDTAPCNDAFSGFFFQTYLAAKQFKIYKTYPNNYNYVAGRNNTVMYNPNSACGTSTFFIENQATAGLYVYTPYRPNQAALDNLYGLGNSCSAYGNRNFWRLFTDWFGSTTAPLIESSGLLLYGWNTGEQITAVFDIKNTSKSTLNVDYIRVRAVNEFGDQYLFAARDGLTLRPGERYKYQQAVTIAEEGTYNFTIDRKVGSTWYPVPFSDFNYTAPTTRERTIYTAPTLDTSLQLDRSSIHVNEPVTASFMVSNGSAIRTTNVGTLKVEAFDAADQQYQFDAENNVVLATGATFAYSKMTSFNRPGIYTIQIVNNNSTDGWNSIYPEPANTNVTRTANITVKEQATITQGLSLNRTTAREGDTLTATFKVRNFGTTPLNIGLLKVEAFDANGRQYQFAPTDANLTLAPGEEYTYLESRPAPTKGLYTFRIVNFNNSIGWNNTSPMSETSSLPRSATVKVKYPVDTTGSLSITPTSPPAGNVLTATFNIQNFGSTSINVGVLKVEAFDSAGRQYQFAPIDVTLAPGEVYTYTQNLTLTRKGTYNFRIVHKHPQFGWNITLPASADGTVTRSQTVIVR